MSRIGKVAYKLKLPGHSKIHPVFHISQLKPVIGSPELAVPLPPDSTKEIVVEPEDVVDHRYDEDGFMEVLIRWRHLPAHETSWLKAREVKHQFPSFSLEDKLSLANRGIDMPWRVYVRKRKKQQEEGRREEETADVEEVVTS